MENSENESAIASVLQNLLISVEEIRSCLVGILGCIDRKNDLHSPMSSILRGLITKNRSLLTKVNFATQETAKYPEREKEIFKDFVNDFIRWLEEDAIVLFKKYVDCPTFVEVESTMPVASLDYQGPRQMVPHLCKYVQFIDETVTVLRNPFVIGKLKNLKKDIKEVKRKHDVVLEERRLNNISFEKITLFDGLIDKSGCERVSSFFKIDDIGIRSKDENIFLIREGNKRQKIELVLLTNHGENDSLAILSVPSKCSDVRYLLYPPFRKNEFLILYNEEERRILLTYVVLSTHKIKESTMTLEYSSPEQLRIWYEELKGIFMPSQELFDSSSSSHEGPKDHKISSMVGLGINILKVEQSPGSLPIVNSPLPDNAHVSSRPIMKGRAHLSHPITLKGHKDDQSSKTQYDRSLDIINEKLSRYSQGLIFDALSKETSSVIKDIRRNTIVSLASYNSHEGERPVSSRAEVEHIAQLPPFDVSSSLMGSTGTLSSKEETVVLESSQFTKHQLQSEPNLLAGKDKIFKTSNGSEINLSTFGKDHNPSFDSLPTKPSSPLSCIENSLDSKQTEKRSRKFIKSLFKKKSAKALHQTPHATMSDMITRNTSETDSLLSSLDSTKNCEPGRLNIRGLTINTDLSTEDITDISTADSDKMATPTTSRLPSPFAIPVSYSSSLTSLRDPQGHHSVIQSPISIKDDEEVITVPEELKAVINEDDSMDLYVSSSSPKAFKVSRWKNLTAKWEMLTLNENVFIKIMINEVRGKGWLIVFKEESYKGQSEKFDQPILLLEINYTTASIRKSSALDLQINAWNPISNETSTFMIRCASGNEANIIERQLWSLMKLNSKRRTSRPLKSSMKELSETSVDSLFIDTDRPSHSSTFTSLESICEDETNELLATGSGKTIKTHPILDDPLNRKEVMASEIQVRLHLQLESYQKVTCPSSWKIVSMCNLTLVLITSHITNKDYYSLLLENKSEGSTCGSWLVPVNQKSEYFERIGKAGLLVMSGNESIHMIEFRGRKEFNSFYNLLQ